MINLFKSGTYLLNGTELIEDNESAAAALKQRLGDTVPTKQEVSQNTIAYNILKKHNVSDT